MNDPTGRSPDDEPEDDRWSPVAEGWGRWAPTLDAATAELDRALLDTACVGRGSHVADLACGTGEPAFGAARRVGPGGHVLAVDSSSGMLRVARIRARAQDLPWLEFVAGSADAIAERGPTHTAALCRFGVMHFDDPPRVLATLRQGLTRGARVACAVWGTRAEVPFLRLPREAAQRHGLLDPEPPDEASGPFRFGDPAAASALLTDAGFDEVGVSTHSVPLRFHGPTEFARFLLDVSQLVRDAAQRAAPQTRERFLADLAETALDHASADHGLCLSNIARIVHGRAP